jgi:predicted type IV restriction endonuclease
MCLSDGEIKEKISEINKEWNQATAKRYDEESVIRHFIYPLLGALGWDVKTELQRGVNRIDCVLYLENRPYIGMEAKSLGYGVLSEDKGGVKFNKDRLLKNCRQIGGVRWAVISRYKETIIYNAENGEKIASFNDPTEYGNNLKDLKILQRPNQC